MILYHALSAYQILCCIEHKILHHKDDFCILILPSVINAKYSNYKDLKKYKFFDGVYLFNSWDYSGILPETVKKLEIDVKNLMPYDIHVFEEIYVAGIHTFFSLYLVVNNISFTMFEDGSGALSRPEILIEINKISMGSKFEILNRFGLFDNTNQCITKKYCNLKNQKEGFFDPLAEHFDIVENLSFLSGEEVEHIKKFFGVPSIGSIPQNTALILTQHFSNLQQLSFEYHVLIYQILADYFLQDFDLFFKTHPDDIMYYEKLFPGCTIIKEPFPSELLPYAFSTLPETISTISSTGIHLIHNLFKNCITFTAVYEKTFLFTHKYYTALKLAESLPVLRLSETGTDGNLVFNLLQYCGFGISLKQNEDVGGKLLLIDNCSCEKNLGRGDILDTVREMTENDAAVFINSDERYMFYEYAERGIFDYIVPIVIKKDLLREEDNYTDPDDETIYFYSRNGEYRKMAEKFTHSRSLNYAGVNISISKMSPEQLRIKVLEGQLAATERRLLAYIENEKKLINEIEELKQT